MNWPCGAAARWGSSSLKWPSIETNQSIAAFLQTSEEYGLGLDFDQRLPSLVDSVTLDEIHAAAAEVLDPARAAVAVASPRD